MPLTGLNRALVTQGLKVMGRRERIGLKALLEVAMAHEAPSAFTCGYAIGPRINAGGRIAEADLGLRLLLCEDADEARRAGRASRRGSTGNGAASRPRSSIMAMELAAAQVAAGHAVLLLSGTGWHPGVVGIVAGRVKERFNRPALVGAELEDGSVKGSGRSVPGLDLGTVIIAARQSGLLLTGGGHAMAAGFSLRAGRYRGVARLSLTRGWRQRATVRRRSICRWIAVLGVAGANAELAAHVGRLAPFRSRK